MKTLRQFFSFFGSKVALAKHYSPPEFNAIIEPFAGSAGYSCLYHEREIILFDIDPVIIGVWNFLIRATRTDILALPLNPVEAERLTKPERDFIGFWWRRCGAVPSGKPVPWMLSGLYKSSFWSEETRERIANQIGLINHWVCKQSDYKDIPNSAATWFVDPPYESQGKRYAYSSIDYAHLSEWVDSRRGQRIVCEDAAATWKQFRPIYENRTVKYKKTKRTIIEGVWP